jgi:PPM family protein phosphatase
VIGFDPIPHFALSDVGLRRSHNQDAFSVILAKGRNAWYEQGHFFIIADGMGGHAVGEKASQKAARDIPLTFLKHAPEGVANALRRAFVETNIAINAIGQNNKEFQGLGTTASALVLRPEGAWIAHVGDSRVYRIRGDVIQQLTFDHSYVWEMARRQGVDPDEIEGVKANVIVRSLGPDALVQVDVEGPHPLEHEDVFVICSDGLSGPVTDSEIGAIARTLPPEEAARFLVQLANLRGGPDNITVMVIHAVDAKATIGPKSSRWEAWRRMHWSLPVLSGGVLLIVIAVLAALGSRPVGLLLFLLAAITIGTGLVGLLLNLRAERRRRQSEPASGELHVYRESPCDVDETVVERLARGIDDLQRKVQESFPKLVPETYGPLYARGDELLKQNNLPGAFREFCRAMHELARSYNSIRTKSEMFQPIWDKRKKKS